MTGGKREIERPLSKEEYDKALQEWNALRDEERRLRKLYYFSVCYGKWCMEDDKPLFIKAMEVNLETRETRADAVSTAGNWRKEHLALNEDVTHDAHVLQVWSTEPINGETYLRHLAASERFDQKPRKK